MRLTGPPNNEPFWDRLVVGKAPKTILPAFSNERAGGIASGSAAKR